MLQDDVNRVMAVMQQIIADQAREIERLQEYVKAFGPKTGDAPPVGWMGRCSNGVDPSSQVKG